MEDRFTRVGYCLGTHSKTRNVAWISKKCTRNFGNETSWKVATSKIEKEIGDNIEMNTGEIGCEDVINYIIASS
jgi:hypothetical protein